jgi:hypothetical protein
MYWRVQARAGVLGDWGETTHEEVMTGECGTR